MSFAHEEHGARYFGYAESPVLLEKVEAIREDCTAGQFAQEGDLHVGVAEEEFRIDRFESGANRFEAVDIRDELALKQQVLDVELPGRVVQIQGRLLTAEAYGGLVRSLSVLGHTEARHHGRQIHGG